VKQHLIGGFLLVFLALFTLWCYGQQPVSSQGQAVLVALSKPTISPQARMTNVEGTVILSVTIQPDGTSEATFVSGPALLKQAALDSATQSRFECRLCSSPLSYRLVYDFKRTSEGSCCDGISAPVQVDQQPQSQDERGHPQTLIEVSTERFCFCDPGPTITKRVRRSLKCFYLWKCSVRG
jgi:hypothetical protein